jgi:hypothetical protein
MEYLKIVCAVFVGIFIIDRVGLWLESKGWIYWRKRKSSGGVGNAFQELNAFFHPSARHTIELKQKYSKQRDEQGDGKE